ncbi:MAG: DsrE family protein [Burkholderiaceae bacterium]
MSTPEALDGIAILLWAADPDVPARLATPFAMASAAAALDTPVEVYFTAASVRLLVPGTADALRASAHPRTIGDWMRDADALGVQFYACTDALVAHGLDRTALIPECAGHGGAVRFMARAADPRWRTLVF